MADGNVKAIELQGIVRNRTKIGVEDGMAEDLLNLRFVDGSWRTSGDGRHVYSMTDNTSGYTYTQVYIHTNLYRHLLGVRDGQLWWFANIDTDGVTFEPLATPVSLTSVTGDIWITQTGHLITIIDESNDFEYLIFKTGDEIYAFVNVDVNGKSNDRTIYPFGQVHFNVHSPWRPTRLEYFNYAVMISTDDVETENDGDFYWVKPDVPCENAIEALVRAKKRNMFVNPFFACAAIRLYDGSFLYATNPVMLYPRQISSSGHRYYISDIQEYKEYDDLTNKRTQASVFYLTSDAWVGRKYYHYICEYSESGSHGVFHRYPEYVNYTWSEQTPESEQTQDDLPSTRDDLPSFMAGIGDIRLINHGDDAHVTWDTMVLGSDLVCSVTPELVLLMEKNKYLFKSICIFVTPEVCIYNFDKELAIPYRRYYKGWMPDALGDTIFFKRKSEEQVINELTKMPFYLIKEYEKSDTLLTNPIIDLKDQEGLLYNLVQQERLSIESTARTAYLPKVTYAYNGRLHIANYKSYPFFGYPIDLFHLHNHSVKVEDGAWFPEDADGQRVLPNLTSNNDEYQQYVKDQKTIDVLNDDGAAIENGAPYFIVKVYIYTAQGEQVVCRYIPAYDTSTSKDGRADFIEDLNPLLTFPDARAKKMEIYFIDHYTALVSVQQTTEPGYHIKWKVFNLQPHPYLNIAYYIDPELKPIKLADFDDYNEERPN